jgi:hypothetical protein
MFQDAFQADAFRQYELIEIKQYPNQNREIIRPLFNVRLTRKLKGVAKALPNKGKRIPR